jgi:hypothetical protein
MAARNTTSKGRPRRTPKSARGVRGAPVRGAGSLKTSSGDIQSGLDAFEDWIEAERQRLMCASAVLGCAGIAMFHDPGGCERPSFERAVEAARRLVDRAISRLDSVYLDPLLSRPRR